MVQYISYILLSTMKPRGHFTCRRQGTAGCFIHGFTVKHTFDCFTHTTVNEVHIFQKSIVNIEVRTVHGTVHMAVLDTPAASGKGGSGHVNMK